MIEAIQFMWAAWKSCRGAPRTGSHYAAVTNAGVPTIRNLIQADLGEYNERYTSFVAASGEAALQYLRATQPEIAWVMIDEMISSPPGTYNPIVPFRRWCISPGPGVDLRGRYELSEVDFVE